MPIVGNQPPVIIPPSVNRSELVALINDNFARLNTQIQNLGYQPSSITLTRPAGSNSISGDISTGIKNAPAFLAFASIPNSSPAFVRPVLDVGYVVSGGSSPGSVNGSILRSLRCLYDPTTGVIRSFIDTTDTSPTNGIAETWTFFIFLIGATAASN
jgi:hypothetical protein